MLVICVSKQPRIDQNLLWLTWRRSVNAILHLLKQISVSIGKNSLHQTREGLMMTCTMILRKVTSQETSRYCMEVIVYGLPSLVCVVSNNTQLTLNVVPTYVH